MSFEMFIIGFVSGGLFAFVVLGLFSNFIAVMVLSIIERKLNE